MGGDLYDHLTSTRISTLIMNKMIFIRAPKIRREGGYGVDLELLTISCSSLCVPYNRRSGLVGESNHLRPTQLMLD